MHEDDPILKIANEIKRYLEMHPDAADSVNGITNWWLLRQRLTEHSLNVSKALALLVHQGYVCQEKQSDGEDLFFALTGVDEIEKNKVINKIRNR